MPAADQANYTIEFKPAGAFQAKADCNQLSGAYTTTSSGGMTITPGPMTTDGLPGRVVRRPVRRRPRRRPTATSIASDVLTLNQNDGGTLTFK